MKKKIKKLFEAYQERIPQKNLIRQSDELHGSTKSKDSAEG